jgi:hypothetical protein
MTTVPSDVEAKRIKQFAYGAFGYQLNVGQCQTVWHMIQIWPRRLKLYPGSQVYNPSPAELRTMTRRYMELQR